MQEYAEVAKTNPEPWTEFQCDSWPGDVIYIDLKTHPMWDVKCSYRRKPKPPKKIKFEAWNMNGELKSFQVIDGGAQCAGQGWTRLPALDLECEVSE